MRSVYRRGPGGLTPRPACGHPRRYLTRHSLLKSAAAVITGQAVGGDDIAVSEGPELGAELPSYPRAEAKTANPQEWQGGSLKPGTEYTAGVRAADAAGGNAGPWATVTFRTTA